MKRKIKSIVFLIMVLIIFLPSVKVQANDKINIVANMGDKAYLNKGTLGFYSIQKKNDEGKWIYVTYSIIKYKDDNGDEHVAYCIDESKLGVGYVKGDVDGYEVELTEVISNEKVWRVIVNGYPYKTPEELGVETEEDAYLATKRAIYSMIKGYTEADVRENYRVGQKEINGQALEDIQRRGEKVINAICNLVNIGNNGSQTIQNELSIIKTSEFEEDEECYYQSYKVQSNVEISKYIVTEILNFPENTKIVDKDGVERTEFEPEEEFKVVINKEDFINDIDGVINVSANCKVYPIYYATAPAGYQDYVICSGYWNNLYSTENLKQEKIEEEPEIPEEPEEPESPEEPEEIEPPQEVVTLPRTGESEILKNIIYSVLLITSIILVYKNKRCI